MSPKKSKGLFKFKQFSIQQENVAFRFGTDSMLLGSWIQGSYSRILDVGTGSGILALMMAQRFPHSTVLGIDIDHHSVTSAQRNVDASPFRNRIELMTQDFNDLDVSNTCDLILSNPPYFSNQLESSEKRRSVARHEVNLTLESLLKKSKELLKPNGAVALVLPYSRRDELIKSEVLHLQKECVVSSYENSSPIRLLVQMGHTPGVSVERDRLFIYSENKDYSESFKEMTADFYLY